MDIKTIIAKSYINLLGWSTKRKIVVIESDDWGSIRMPSKESYLNLLKAGIPVDKCHYCRFDSLESEKDLSMLLEILYSIKDKNGNPSILTANAVVANPDFDKIRRDDFEIYSYKKITENYIENKGCENSLKLWQEGQAQKCFKVQSHSREHLNVSRWISMLKENFQETKLAFDNGVFGLSQNITSENRKSFLAALDFDSEKEATEVNLIVEDGLRIFNEIFGFQSKSFIAPNYIWSERIERTLSDNGVLYIQGPQTHSYKLLNGKNSKKRIRYFGRKNKDGQIDLARNAYFEPSQCPDKDWISQCLKDIDFAFKWNKPIVICSHRVNFMGTLDEDNRSKNLKLLRSLLKSIVNKWPDVEFMSTDKLGDLISNKII